MGDRILLFGRGHAWFEVSPSRGAFEHCWKWGRRGRGGEEEENKKKKYISSSLHTVYPDLWSLAPSQMKFPCRWKHGQFFILRFPYGVQPGRVTYFSVLTSKWTSLVYHIYSTRPHPSKPIQRERRSVWKVVPRRFRDTSVILIRPCALCYQGFSTVVVRSSFLPFFFFFFNFRCAFKGSMVFIEDGRRWTGHFLTKFLFY